MSRLVVRLPSDRNRSGTIQLLGADGAAIGGPFNIAGRSSDLLAAAHGNASRDPLLPYGDTPTGTYLVSAQMGTGNRTALSKDEFGPAGVIVLEASAGDAALADANGRFNIVIQGGDLAADGRLRSTAGGLRMANPDLRALIRALPKPARIFCDVIEADDAIAQTVFDDDQCSSCDPLPLSFALAASRTPSGKSHIAHRGTLLMLMGASFAVQGAAHAKPLAPAVSPLAKRQIPRDVTWIPLAAAAAQSDAYNSPPPPDNDALIKYMDQHAADKSGHRCGEACREGLEVAGVDIPKNEYKKHAGDYGPVLEKHGYAVVAQSSGPDQPSGYQPKPGDVAVFETSTQHRDGHMEIYDGHRWVSDFKQNHYTPYSGDPKSTPPSHIYRFEKKQ